MNLPPPGVLRSFFGGASITIGAVAVAALFAVELGSWVPAKVLLWPAWLLLAALPCFNMGTLEQPRCEGTPIHLAAATLGLAFTVIFYAALVYVVLCKAGTKGSERADV
jgi:hypothetical protein